MAPWNPHPPLAAFPCVLTLVLLVFEILDMRRPGDGYRRASNVLVALVVVSTVVTYLSGTYASDLASQSFAVEPRTIATHQAFAKSMLLGVFVLGTLAAARCSGTANARRVLDRIYRGALLIFAALAIWTSQLGGDLVFAHGAGVSLKETRPGPAAPDPR